MACITTATINLCEEGTGKISFILQDEDENIVTPTEISWQLSDILGTIINSNTFANNDITGTETSVTIGDVTGSGFIVGLTGDDLSLLSTSDDGRRRFAVQARYNSSLGTGMYLKGELAFTVTNLLNFS